MARIYSIVYQPIGTHYSERQSDYLRTQLQTATLVAGHGIEGDQKAGKHPDRQLNLLSYEWLENAGQKGYRANPGEFGEQIVIQGLALDELESGTQVQIGSQAVVEIIKPRTGCDRLQAAQPLPVKNLRTIGMMARVIQSGVIHIDDDVSPVSAAV